MTPDGHDSAHRMALTAEQRGAGWNASFASQLRPVPGTVAGMIYLQVSTRTWPPWIRFVARSAAANSDAITFYFLGPRLDFDLATECSRCIWIGVGVDGVIDRIEKHLGVERSKVRRPSGRKVCDLKPMWPALFPELTERHAWIGYADTDVIFGDLSSEVERLSDSDDLLTPQMFYPHPLSNGNFLLMRTSQKMVNAFRRSKGWQKMLHSYYMGFDEWGTITRNNGIPWGSRSMAAVYQDMLLAGDLRVQPTARMFVLDTIVIKGTVYPTISTKARAGFWWRNGSLIAERYGPCVCPNDVIPQHVLTACEQCISSPGSTLNNVVTHRRLEVLGLHFLTWKRTFWRIYGGSGSANSTDASQAEPPVPLPVCAASGNNHSFSVGEKGFSCGAALSRLQGVPAALGTWASQGDKGRRSSGRRGVRRNRTKPEPPTGVPLGDET